jgi:AraC family transcriptional regulator
MPTTRRRAEQSYRERIARVIAAIVADPMAEHRLGDLARLAHFSPFHFHRVYSSIAGESVATTVRRVRLALATRLLEAGGQSVTQVAMAVGYDSPQAFTRAFGQFTGQSPSEFQHQMHRVALDAGAVAPVRIVERPAQQVHALRHRGPPSTIPHTQRLLRVHAAEQTVSDWLGISDGDPDDPEDCKYYAAAACSVPAASAASWPADAEIELLEIPAGRYALHRLAGPYARINATINTLYARWLPGSGYEPDDRPTLEHYLNSPRQVSRAELRTDLLIPIRAAH